MTADPALLALIALALPELAFLLLAVVVPLRRAGRPAAYLSIACAAGWIGLWLAGGRLPYNPYPIITPPAFDPIAGALAALLATPALFGPTPSEGRARTKPRHASRRASSPAQRESRLDPATSIHVPEK